MSSARQRHALVALTAATLTLSACGAGAPDVDGFITVSGGQLDVWCDGGEGPTVIFVSAIGGDDSLEPIAERIRGDTYACLYDRPGDGETQPPDAPRTAAGDAADLHELLDAADIPTPVVLVAHSYGGLVSVIAAAEHPDDVAGVVLVDASHPEQETRMSAVMSAEQQEVVAAEFENFPHVDFYASLDEAAEAYDSFPDIPLTIISATRGMAPACDQDLPCEEMQAIWLEVQSEYETLAPGARHVVAETGHYVHEEDPDLVVREINELLERIGPSPSR